MRLRPRYGLVILLSRWPILKAVDLVRVDGIYRMLLLCVSGIHIGFH